MARPKGWDKQPTKGQAKYGTWGTNRGPYKKAKVPPGGKRKARLERYKKEAQGPPGKKTAHAVKKLGERAMRAEDEGIGRGKGVWGNRSGIYRVPQGTTRKKAAAKAVGARAARRAHRKEVLGQVNKREKRRPK